MKAGFDDFIKDKLPHEKVFKYKASGDALGKKFIRQIRVSMIAMMSYHCA